MLRKLWFVVWCTSLNTRQECPSILCPILFGLIKFSIYTDRTRIRTLCQKVAAQIQRIFIRYWPNGHNGRFLIRCYNFKEKLTIFLINFRCIIINATNGKRWTMLKLYNNTPNWFRYVAQHKLLMVITKCDIFAILFSFLIDWRILSFILWFQLFVRLEYQQNPHSKILSSL